MKKILTLSIVILITTGYTVFGQAFWTQYQGPYSGNFNAFVRYKNVVCAGSWFNGIGIYRSTDYGKSWKTSNYTLGNIYSMISLDSLIIASSDGTPNTLVSNDSGKNWYGANELQNPNGAIYQFHIFKNKLFGGQIGVFEFDAVSKNWIKRDTGFKEMVFSLTSIGDVLFCGTSDNGIFCSKDTGKSWQYFPTPYGSKTNIYNCHDTLFIDLGQTTQIYYSPDTGKNWHPASYNLPFHAVWSASVFNNNFYIGTGLGVYKLNTGASKWEQIDKRVIHAMYADDSLFLTGNAGGIYRWDDLERKFILSNYGINSAEVNDILIFDKKLYCATYSGAAYTDDNGQTWNDIAEVNNLECHALVQLDTLLFIGTGDGIYRTSEKDSVWNRSDNGIEKDDTFSFSPKYIWDLNIYENILYAATNKGVYKSSDRGQNWSIIQNKRSGDSVQTLKVEGADGMVLAGDNFGLYKLNQAENKWELVGFDQREIKTIKILKDGVFVCALSGGGPSQTIDLYKSVDSCKSWTLIKPMSEIRDISQRGDNIYASGYGNIFYTHDRGATWMNTTEAGLPNCYITSMIQLKNCFYVATFGKGVFERNYLKLNGCTSDTYEITDDSVINLTSATTVSDLEDNMIPEYGSSLKYIPGNHLKQFSQYVSNGDTVKIVAEDGVTSKNYIVRAPGNGLKSQENSASFEIRISPVPVKDKLMIASNRNLKSFEIINLTGSVISRGTFPGNEISCKEIKNGIYIIKFVASDNSLKTLKFVKE